jgi:hypothetical protein
VERKREKKIKGYGTILERKCHKNYVLYYIEGTSLYRGEEGEQALLGPAHKGEEAMPRADAQEVIQRLKCLYTLISYNTP